MVFRPVFYCLSLVWWPNHHGARKRQDENFRSPWLKEWFITWEKTFLYLYIIEVSQRAMIEPSVGVLDDSNDVLHCSVYLFCCLIGLMASLATGVNYNLCKIFFVQYLFIIEVNGQSKSNDWTKVYESLSTPNDVLHCICLFMIGLGAMKRPKLWVIY
jgi:hypothetical protein